MSKNRVSFQSEDLISCLINIEIALHRQSYQKKEMNPELCHELDSSVK